MPKAITSVLCALTILASSPVLAADSPQVTPDQIANTAFTLLKAGKSREAIKETIGKSPIVAASGMQTEPLASQIDSAIRIYGPVRTYELVSEAKIGTTVVRRIYVVQHDMMLTRWQLDFGRMPSGWAMLNLSFDDQVKTWPVD